MMSCFLGCHCSVQRFLAFFALLLSKRMGLARSNISAHCFHERSQYWEPCFPFAFNPVIMSPSRKAKALSACRPG